jgi:hypothetical protein
VAGSPEAPAVRRAGDSDTVGNDICTNSDSSYHTYMIPVTDVLRVHPRDNVLVALRDLQPGETL